MNCETEMYIHFVMTANDLIVAASKETDKITKLGLLTQAMTSLNEAETYGAPKETLKELRNLANDRFMEAVND